jgi:hypothetical protein
LEKINELINKEISTTQEQDDFIVWTKHDEN